MFVTQETYAIKVTYGDSFGGGRVPVVFQIYSDIVPSVSLCNPFSPAPTKRQGLQSLCKYYRD